LEVGIVFVGAGFSPRAGGRETAKRRRPKKRDNDRMLKPAATVFTAVVFTAVGRKRAYNSPMNRQFAAPVPAGEIGAILARELAGAQCAFLFGSSETRSFAEESDVDVAVLLPGTLDLSARLALKGSLETMLGRSVDLVDLRGADPILAFQVLRFGRPVVMRDRKAYEAFVARTLSDYADLKLDRRPVEVALLREVAP
jgi:predicted nucleotidyltransferase